MSTYLRLLDGTEFRINATKGGPVIVGFEESKLERLLRLPPNEKVILHGVEMEYALAKKRIGSIIAYIPNEETYLKICNEL